MTGPNRLELRVFFLESDLEADDAIGVGYSSRLAMDMSMETPTLP